VTTRVFVSRPNALTLEQTVVAERWDCTLRSMGLETLMVSGCQSGRSLWQELRLKLSSATGVVILGMRQLRVDSGCWRPGTTESMSPRRWWTTPWNQLEAGMGIMLELPVLVLRERGVGGGILDAHMWDNGLYGAELDGPADDPSVRRWAAAVRARSAGDREDHPT
jgi:hypothetical protein